MKCDAALAHLVERHLAKVEVASSSLIGRSIDKDSCGAFNRRILYELLLSAVSSAG